MTITGTEQDLVEVLESLGVEVTRSSGKEITGRCPVHEKTVGHRDNSPSWSMSQSTGLWICYSCGARGGLPSLVSQLTGSDDTVLTVHRYLIEAGLKRHLEPEENAKREEPEPDWRTYEEFIKVPAAVLKRRKLAADSADLYGLRWDRADRCWIIPVISPLGELLGWQRKRTGFFLNEPEGMAKSTTLFGFHQANRTIGLLVESPLDVVRLHTVMEGVSGVAAFGVYVSDEQIELMAALFDRLIIGLDNDLAGIRVAKSLQGKLPMFRRGVRFLHYGHTRAKDLGDMTDAEIETALRKSSVLPWWRQ